MKPLTEKTYVDQALANGHGVTWLDSGRIPIADEKLPTGSGNRDGIGNTYQLKDWISHNSGNITSPQGRFPANLLVSDDVLNDGVERKSGWCDSDKTNKVGNTWDISRGKEHTGIHISDTGSFSRYFSLDSWWDERIKKLPESVQKTFPFMIIPKASKAEKNKGCEDLPEQNMRYQDNRGNSLECFEMEGSGRKTKTVSSNHHPTVKSLKLFSYLITLGSREGDLILDPFAGSGTSAVACKALNRHYVCIEQESEYVAIAEARIKAEHSQPELQLAGG
jgi:hypothetical protein